MWIELFFIFIIGTIFGSFLNASEKRIRIGKTLWGRSECPMCNITIRWFDNVPVLSWLFLKARCRQCNAKIHWQYPVVELMVGVLFVLLSAFHVDRGFDLMLLRDLFIGFILSFIFLYDLKYKEIPDLATLPSIVVIGIFSLVFGWLSWQSMLIAIIVGGGFFLLQFAVSKGRWIGGGDIRVGVLMGVILGWPLILVALLIAYVMGAIVSIILLAMKKKRLASETPFGTYLSLATVVTMVWGVQILEWYLGFLS